MVTELQETRCECDAVFLVRKKVRTAPVVLPVTEPGIFSETLNNFQPR